MIKKEELFQKVKTLPTSSGVYKMFNSHSEIIYVGKAKNLRNRVKSYFDNSPKTLKTLIMVDSVDHFEYIITNSEQDAFSLECNLIKENMPKYNILLKDDKQFPYLRIDRKQKYPEVNIVRKVKNDGAKYFGPFVTGIRISEMLALIKSAFGVRTCKHNFDKIKPLKRECLLGTIGSCSAPCIQKISEEEYNKIIDSVEDFLNGKNNEIKKILNKKMNVLAEVEDFENAIKYRNLLDALSKSEEKLLSSMTTAESFDIFAIANDDKVYAIAILVVRNGKMVAESNQIIESVDEAPDILSSYIAQYYETNLVPKEILLTNDFNDELQNYISSKHNKNVSIIVPKIGKKLEMCKMAEANAKEYLVKNKLAIQRKEEMTFGALQELKEILNLESDIDRIEGYDISNISGTNNVSSMVVFEGGKPAKSEYRKFKIKTFEGANDFASMEETLTRRLGELTKNTKNFSKAPDIILIDGGLGQLHFANAAQEKLGYQIPIISLAKKEEEIYTIFSSEPICLSEDSSARKLLQRVRDEAHRFAVGYHRTLRGKNLTSDLENIVGVGKKRARAILSEFASSDALLSAGIKEIANIDGINGITAKKIYDYLHR